MTNTILLRSLDGSLFCGTVYQIIAVKDESVIGHSGMIKKLNIF